MATAVETWPQSRNGRLHIGDRVVVVDAPAWCRRYLAGRVGRVVRILPFGGGDAWVRFERPVGPWCERMDPVEEFPFSPGHLAPA